MAWAKARRFGTYFGNPNSAVMRILYARWSVETTANCPHHVATCYCWTRRVATIPDQLYV